MRNMYSSGASASLTPEPETLVKLMLTTEEKWSAVSGFATTVMKRLRRGAGAQKTRRPTQQQFPVIKNEKTENVEKLNR